MSKVETIVIPAHNLRVVTRCEVHSELPVFKGKTWLEANTSYPCYLTQQSTVFAELDNGLLGLKPGEFHFECPWFRHNDTVLPREDHEKPGHCWRVVPVGDGGHIEVNGEKRAILRVFVGVKGWLVEHAAWEES